MWLVVCVCVLFTGECELEAGEAARGEVLEDAVALVLAERAEYESPLHLNLRWSFELVFISFHNLG